MRHRIATRSLALCLLFGFAAHAGFAQQAPFSQQIDAAQQWRPDGAFYLRPQLGLNTYSGDRTDRFLSGAPGPGTALEAGYTRRLGALSGDLGLYFLAGRYPSVRSTEEPAPTPVRKELEVWRFTLSPIGRIGFAPEARLNPYVQLGTGLTGGVVDGDFKVAFSPLGGFGLDYALTSQVGLFAEATGILSLPDERLDRASGIDGQSGDWFGFVSGGVRIGFNDPFTPVRVLDVNGPTRLTTGEQAIFAATANEDEATGTVTYRWDFGDGQTAEGPTASHRFDAPGNYTITLTSSNRGSTDSQLLTVAVSAPESAIASSEASEDLSEGAESGNAEDAEAQGNTRREEETVRFPETASSEPASSKEPAESPERAASKEGASEDLPACDEIIELNAAYFEAGSATLNREGKRALRENTEILEERCPNMAVRLDVYVAPDEADKEALGAARAAAVREFYAQRGIAPGRIAQANVKTVAGQTSKEGGLASLRRADTVPLPEGRRPAGDYDAATADAEHSAPQQP